MEYKKAGSIVLDLNSLNEGLNFLVPREWWTGFLALNTKKERHEELEIPDSHPLSFFFEIAIIQKCTTDMRGWVRGHENKLKSLEQHAQSTGQMVNGLVAQTALEGLEEGSKKRNRPFFEWWDFQSIVGSKSYNKILLSPFIQRKAFADLLDGFEWKVVSPRLYKLICQANLYGKDQQYRDYIIGLPVFLKPEDIRLGQCEMEYILGPQVKVNAYFYNTLGLKSAFIGAVEGKLGLDCILRYLFEGLYKMAVHELGEPSKCFRNQLRLLNKKIYCNFDDKDQNCARLQWEPFNKLFSEPPADGVEVIELSSFCKNQVEDDEVVQVVQPIKGNKKLKRDQVLLDIIERTARKKSSPSTQQRLKNRMERFNKMKKTHPDWFQQAAQPIPHQEPHYSTEEETPSVILEEGVQLHHTFFQSREENRIYYPMWKNFHSVHSLARLADIKMSESLPLPFSAPNKKIIKTKDGKRVHITTSSNRLTFENGETVQLQQQHLQQKGVPEDVMTLLENLALEIRGERRKMNIELLIKEEELEAAKEKIDLESRTCKNEEEEMDDLDEVESREC